MFTIIYVLFCSFSINAQTIIYDESHIDDDFWNFKVKLECAIASKDTAILKSLFYKRVLTAADSYVCTNGCTPDEVIHFYFRDKKDNCWDELMSILKYGFSSRLDTMEYSYVIEKHDSLIFEAPSYLKIINDSLLAGKLKIAILGNQISLYENHCLKSKVITYVSYGLYSYDEDEMESPRIYTSENNYLEWIKLTLDNGIEGYVLNKHTSNVILRNLKVAKFNGEWKIVEFYQEPGC